MPAALAPLLREFITQITNFVNLNRMINYSIAARYSTPGDSTSTLKYYANAQYTEIMEFDDFCKHIATHGSVYSRADVAAIISQAVDCLRELVLNGKRITLGDLGTFSASIKSTGALSASLFDSTNIYYVGLNWDPGDVFDNMLDDATFQLVTTRDQQAAVVAAVKAGETSVDWSSSEESES